MKKIIQLTILLILTTIVLAACGEENSTGDKNETDSNEHASMDHSDMDHSSSGEVPEGLEKAENPAYEVGSKVMIKEGHMKGMEGAEATITGAYHTTAYVVSYTPTTGGDRVENHKWVIHEEIKDAGEAPIKPGTEVILDASHMKGMDGAEAVIESAKETTVYMITYTPTTGGEKVTNHKWVTEEELAPLE